MNNKEVCMNNDIENDNRGNDIKDENGDNMNIGCISERGDLLQTDPEVRGCD